MSQFTLPLIGIIPDDDEHIELVQPFEYHVGSYPSNDIIIIPTGFKSDFASIPRFIQWIIPKRGKYSKAAIVHDYLYVYAIKNKKYADDVFLEAMLVLKVNKNLARIMHWFVTNFGQGNYPVEKSRNAFIRSYIRKILYNVS